MKENEGEAEDMDLDVDQQMKAAIDAAEHEHV